MGIAVPRHCIVAGRRAPMTLPTTATPARLSGAHGIALSIASIAWSDNTHPNGRGTVFGTRRNSMTFATRLG